MSNSLPRFMFIDIVGLNKKPKQIMAAFTSQKDIETVKIKLILCLLLPC